MAAVVVACFGVSAHAADPHADARRRMVAEEIEAAGITDPRVLDAMRATPRHEFMPAAYRQYAHVDAALPIGDRQTISPPYVVAYMTEQLRPEPTNRVLEIGTGSGYQAAVLSPLVSDVFTIEIVPALGKRAARTLKRLGYDNVHLRIGDGYQGWPQHAPFDKIIVTCSPEKIPQPLVDQLAEGGQMIIPVGERYQQNLFRMTKRKGQLVRESLQATLFVPMTGAAEEARQTLPDAANPRVVNGGFQQTLPESRDPAGWHYLRSAEVVDGDGDAAFSYLRFANPTPGLPSRALQGLAVDGRRVSRVELSARVRGVNLRAGLEPRQRAAIMITFYNARRAAIDTAVLGPWDGSFDWRTESQVIAVPLAAREANVRLGMHGGAGTLDVTDLRLSVRRTQE